MMTAGIAMGSSCFAQETQPRLTSDSKSDAGSQVETIAVLPWRLENGTDGAKKTAKEFLATLLTKVKVDAASEVRTTTAWEAAAGSGEIYASGKLPSAANMLRVGNKMSVDWVMSGSVAWHSRSIWVGLGPKTKSTATISVRIVDVKNQVVTLEVADLKVDDTAKEDTLKALGAVFVSGLFTVVSGGPKTPHEQRAVQIGIAKALEPWLAQRLKIQKIDIKQ